MQYIIWVLAAIAVIALFGLTVFVHELGHYLAARFCGMTIDTFSIGFGKSIWQRRVGGTLYKVGWIPFGGYVALPQLDPSGMDAVQGSNAPEGDGGEPRRLVSASWKQRILVSISGPVGNVVLAFFVALLIRAFPPVGVAPGLQLNGPVVGQIEEDSAAAAAGLRYGDQILLAGGTRVSTWDEFVTECHLASGDSDKSIGLVVSNRLDGAVRGMTVPLVRNEATTYYGVEGISGVRLCGFGEILEGWPAAEAGVEPNDIAVTLDGEPIYNSERFIAAIKDSGGKSLALSVLRKTELVEITLAPRFNSDDQRWQIGAILNNLDPKVPMWMQYRHPIKQLKGDFQSVGRVLQALFAPKRKGESRRVAGALSGPIVILTTLWLNTMANLLYTLGFVRFLNINLAIINLLPFPVLDGGHILFALYEGIFRRKVPQKVVAVLVNGFAVLLIALFVFISLRDTLTLGRIFGRPKAVVEAVEAGDTPETEGP